MELPSGIAETFKAAEVKEGRAGEKIKAFAARIPGQ